MKDIEIIAPVLNEVDNVEKLIKRIDNAFRAKNYTYGVIFIDDHSTDGTYEKLKGLEDKYPIQVLRKVGKGGKAYSILEGSRLADSELIAMIDADLQYPPEILPEMIELMRTHGVVVANRKQHSTSLLRKTASKINKFIFGKLLLNFKVDTQSGLKVFRKEIIEHILDKDVTPWTLDMHILQTALELGYTIGCVDIDFLERQHGKSKVKLGRASFEIMQASLKLKLAKNKIYPIKSNHSSNLLGSGFAYKRKRFITHTNLSDQESALKTTQFWQKLFILGIFFVVTLGLFLYTKNTLIILIALLSILYFIDVLFSFYVLLKSLHFPPELKFDDIELSNLADRNLPIYTILCPLYHESEVLLQFIKNINNLDWPKEKLDVMLLLEEDDEETINAASKLKLPSYIRTVIVPDSQPKTKPKACNYGLALAKGEYVVVYDAEDEPDIRQLKKAYLGFQKLDEKVFCLQSKLNYFNPNHNILTRLFTAEYSLWFDVILPGLQSIDATIPLGGTSNHFRTKQLKGLHAWDPFNVTEDCDLGVRLFKKGYKTAIIDSTTYEEANGRIKSWIKQRSRWIKGYYQTYLVHMREPVSFFKKHGIQALIFQLVIGMRMTFILINPILWITTLSYFTLYSLVGPAIQSVYPALVFYIAVFSLVFGNFMYLYNYMIGCAKRNHWSLVKYVYLVPFYWLLTSIAAIIAAYQLVVKPHYWEKTQHGINLSKNSKKAKKINIKVRVDLDKKIPWNSSVVEGAFLVFACGVANVLNFLYGVILSRSLDNVNFGLVSLMSSFYFISSIFTIALSKAVTHKSAFIFGKYKSEARDFWKKIRRYSLAISVIVFGLWLSLIPMLMQYLKLQSALPLIIFSPVWLFAFASAVDIGYLSGSLKFSKLALVILIEAGVKLVSTILFLQYGYSENYLYSSIPLSIFTAFIIGWFLSARITTKSDFLKVQFPYKFYLTAILIGLSSMSFLAVDLIYAEHFLSTADAGKYALISTIGKMIFYAGTVLAQFINPLISKSEGENADSKAIFKNLLILTALMSLVGYLVVGVLGEFSAPLIFGNKAIEIVDYLPLFGLGVFSFTIGISIVTYYQAKRIYIFAIAGFLLSIIQIYGLGLNSDNLENYANFMGYFGMLYLSVILSIHYLYQPVKLIYWNLGYLLDLFRPIPNGYSHNGLKILIFNWYDVKHKYAGGAEIYIQKIAEKLVEGGYKVTMFSGNDGHNPRYEVINGVQIVRRGGLFTVALWAFVYYLLKFRNKYDVIIDIPKGVPFFTPLYVRKPKLCLVHHVHTEMFMNGLGFPLKQMAVFFEKNLMPFVYRGVKFVTISESSKKAMRNIGIKGEIAIIPPGVDFIPMDKQKTTHPTIVYLGRLRKYKSIDTVILATRFIKDFIPNIELLIAGTGEDEERLKNITQDLNLEQNVKFLGKVSELRKAELYSTSWVCVQPSTVEGWGMTVIEANKYGTPVVASDVYGLRDSVLDKQTGILTEVGNPNMFAISIMRLITDEPLRKIYAENAKNWAGNFTWEVAAEKFRQAIISRLIEAQSRIGANILAYEELESN